MGDHVGALDPVRSQPRHGLRLGWSLALLAAVVLWLVAGCASPPKTPTGARNIAAEILAQFQQSVAAWNAGDLNAFVSIYADDATFALPESFVHGRAAIRDYYAPLFQPGAGRDTLGFDQFDVQVLSPDVALVLALYTNSRAREVVRRGTTTLIFRLELGRWRIIHDHSS